MHRAALSYASAPLPTSDDELIRQHASLIERVARRICARTGNVISPDDLWSAGAMGLLDAARRFDAGREVRFESFAEHRIRGAMIDELRNMDHLPRRLRAETDQVRKSRATLSQKLGREPTLEELAEAMNLPIEDVSALDTLMQPAQPITAELPIASSAPSADEQLDELSTARQLTAAISKLPERLQILMSLHYVEGLTYKEIAKALEVSEARVCQLHADAVKKLRALLSEGGDDAK